jgi:N-methylhydantoinase A
VYGYAAPTEPVEIVTLRVTATVPVASPSWSSMDRAVRRLGDARTGARRVWFEATGFVACPIYARERLPRGAKLHGPAILEQPDATTVVDPRDTATVDRDGNVIIAVGSR